LPEKKKARGYVSPHEDEKNMDAEYKFTQDRRNWMNDREEKRTEMTIAERSLELQKKLRNELEPKDSSEVNENGLVSIANDLKSRWPILYGTLFPYKYIRSWVFIFFGFVSVS